jgi:branched-chain amino acid transport system ATP-binding protein
MTANTPILEVRSFNAGYGKVLALQDAALLVPRGSVVTVIGPNGAGKSTLLNGLMGLLRASGEVMLDGHPIARKSVEARVMAGMSLVPERRELFADMSVIDNLLLGSFRRHRAREHHPMDQLDWVYALFPRLKERSNQLAGTLSGGERQMLAVGRALMGQPRLLMLDEPSLGLAPRIVTEMLEVIGGLRAHGVSTLLVEQNARAALRLADYGYVLENGRIVLEGPAGDLARNPRIVQSYMGLSGHNDIQIKQQV